MVISNLRDLCKTIVKELIIRYEFEDTFNKWSFEQIKEAINFIKSKRQADTEVFETLIRWGYIQEDKGVFSLGTRARKLSIGWEVM